jgi:hypothetical protein
MGMTESPELVKISAYNPPNYFAPTTRALSVAEDVTKGDFNQKITIRDIYAGTKNYTGSRADRGLVQFNSPWDLVTGGTYPNYLTDTQAIRPLIVVDNVQVAELALAVVGNCKVHGSTISKLQTRTDPVGPVFGPDETQIVIKCYNSDIELTSSLTGSDSFELPDEVFTFNCNFGDLIKRDGNPNTSGLANIFKGRGNTKIATTAWTSLTPYLFDGEDAYLKGVVTPVGAVTPDFIGQEYEDTVLNKFYKATGINNLDWLVLN